ncbi:hypothetical protein GWG65_17425 [Bradyrhizobium sp. CSA207]|uniref:hypothetical protein n=1 Tax=Bradyrhizobium sp. CSA207 TaxID=2698826 RepID=UPI0023AF2F9C|nr:hypothetical protein [Bradyrhizobium sp. CSA207]MDE5443200.1 hypothetical protein [Bradyrhizobium sp. CSA207]
MKPSRKYRAFLQEPTIRNVFTTTLQYGAVPFHVFVPLVRARFGNPTRAERQTLGKEIRRAAEAFGFRHRRTGVRPAKPIVGAGSSYL